MSPETKTYTAQPGPQLAFLASPAHICIYGGAAGGGKTFGLLLDAMRYCGTTPGYVAIIFRRTYPEIMDAGGLIDKADPVYLGSGAKRSGTTYTWPNGSQVRFSHLQHESDCNSHQGSEYCYIAHDELTLFTERQFWFFLSRNRSTCGQVPRMRATVNPDPDSFVAGLIAWWLDKDGFPIPERSGVVRWFERENDKLIWHDTKPNNPAAKSFTFIAAKLSDNPILETLDPGYRFNLEAMGAIDRARYLEGNWLIRPKAGDYFNRSWVEVVDVIPGDVKTWVRGWDRAATRPSPQNPDPDYTASVLMGRRGNGKLVVAHAMTMRDSTGAVKQATLNLARQDPKGCTVAQWQDPGGAGVFETEDYASYLQGYVVSTAKAAKDKQSYFKPFSSQAEHHKVQVVRGAWNQEWFDCLEAFPGAKHDDLVDATSRAFLELAGNSIAGGAAHGAPMQYETRNM